MAAVWSVVITLGMVLALLFLAYNFNLIAPVTSPSGRDTDPVGSSILATPSPTFDKIWCKSDGELEACAVPTDKTWCEVGSQLAICPSPIGGYMRDCEWMPELATYKDCKARGEAWEEISTFEGNPTDPY